MKAKDITFRGFSSPRYTQVPDELFDDLMAQLSGAELKVLLYIIRRTFGFKKDADNISLNQICNGITTRAGEVLDKGTGLSLSTVQLALKGLIEKRCVVAFRNRSKEKGDMPTTFSLNTIPPTDNRQGGIPIIGNGGYLKSVSQEPVLHSTDLQHRNSKAKSQEREKHPTPGAQQPASPTLTGTTPFQNPRVVANRPPRTGTLRSLTDILAAHQPTPQPPHAQPVAPATKRKLAATPQIQATITEISEGFADTKHLKANTAQAVNLWQESGRSEALFVHNLFEARSITRQQRNVRKPMPYFFNVLRDVLGLKPEPSDPSAGG